MTKMTEQIQDQGVVHDSSDDSYRVSSISHKDALKILNVVKEEVIKVIMNRPEYAGENRLHSETLLISRIIEDIEGME